MSTGLCDCGSGRWAYWIRDGHFIPLCKACEHCEFQKLKRYRKDILSQYKADEPINPDE